MKRPAWLTDGVEMGVILGAIITAHIVLMVLAVYGIYL